MTVDKPEVLLRDVCIPMAVHFTVLRSLDSPKSQLHDAVHIYQHEEMGNDGH